MKKNWSEKMQEGFKKLKTMDPYLKQIIEMYGYPKDRAVSNSFATLTKIIIGQQISRSAANSIIEKLAKKKLISIKAILKENNIGLKNLGLSSKKIDYIKNLAIKIHENQINLKDFETSSDEHIYNNLIDLKGIGEWTINNYMLFALQKVDSWPGGDLALQEAVKKIKNLKSRPNTNEMKLMAENWKPYRGSAALILWHFYAQIKNNYG